MPSQAGLVRYGSPVGVTPNVDYVLSVYVQAATAARYCYLEIRWRDASGALLGSVTSSPTRDNTETPTRLTLRGTAPVLAATAVLLFGAIGQTDGEVHYWDAAQWERGQLVTAYAPRPGEILPGTITTPMISVGAIDASRLAGGSVGRDQLAVGAVGGAQLAENAVTTRELAEGSVLAENIFANAITADKIAANAVTARVIAAEAVVAGALAANSVTAGAVAANAITTDKIAANSVSAQKIAANSVQAQHVVAGAIDAVAIAASAITADKMRANSITAGNAAIAYGAIGEATIQDGVIGTAKIKDAAIISAKIQDGAIGSAKIGYAAINSAQIGSLEATKITSGYLYADVQVAGRIMTSPYGPRVVMDGTGLRAYDNYGETLALRNDGSANFRGRITASDMVGSAFRTQDYGSRVELRGDQYGAYDAVRWYNDYNNLIGEIRGFMGDIGGDGLHLNSTLELGNTQSVIYQVGRRVTIHQNTRVRAGYRVDVGASGNTPGYVGFPYPFPSGATPIVTVIVHHSPGGGAVFAVIGNVSHAGFEIFYSTGGGNFVSAQRQISYQAEWFYGS